MKHAAIHCYFLNKMRAKPHFSFPYFTLIFNFVLKALILSFSPSNELMIFSTWLIICNVKLLNKINKFRLRLKTHVDSTVNSFDEVKTRNKVKQNVKP